MALIAGQQYFDFRSYGDIVGKANKLLVQHPFGRLAKAERDALDEMQAMRDHVLHRSRRSRARLRQFVPRRSEVGIHLTAVVKGQARIRSYLDRVKAVSVRLR